MPFHIGPWELGLVLAIVLIIFGVGRLPQVGGAVGKAIRAFRKGQSGDEDTADASEETPKSKKETDEE